MVESCDLNSPEILGIVRTGGGYLDPHRVSQAALLLQGQSEGDVDLGHFCLGGLVSHFGHASSTTIRNILKILPDGTKSQDVLNK